MLIPTYSYYIERDTKPMERPPVQLCREQEAPLGRPDAAIRLILTERVRNDGAWLRLTSLSLVLDPSRSPIFPGVFTQGL